MTDRTAAKNLNRAFGVPDVILMAMDLEDDPCYLLSHAAAQARDTGASLLLRHVVPPPETIPLDTSAMLPADDEELERHSKRRLEDHVPGALLIQLHMESALHVSPLVRTNR